MIEPKVNLTIILQGRVLLSKEECLKTTQKVIGKKKRTVLVEDNNKVNHHSMTVRDKNNKNPEVISFTTRKCKSATQVLNMSRESYDYMTSNICPEWESKKNWSTYSKKERLEKHLNQVASALGGKVLSYKVFED